MNKNAKLSIENKNSYEIEEIDVAINWSKQIS